MTTAARNTPPLIGLASLMRTAFSGGDLKPIGAQLIERSRQHPDDANALLDLSHVLQLTGNRELALATQMQALQLQPVFHVPGPRQPAIRVLAMMAPGDLMANTPLEFLVEDSDIGLDLLYIAPGLTELPELPEHDLLFVAVGESDENRPLLAELEAVLQQWPRPVLNRPAHIAALSRDSSYRLLADAPGVQMPPTLRIARDALQAVATGSRQIAQVAPDTDFPLIVRPVGSHAGSGLERIADAEALAAYLQNSDSPDYYISRFIDYRNEDGLYRKYRVMLIGGRPFLAHMAISSHWMIHYLNAGMVDSADKRDEEARTMAGFDEGFALRHKDALAAVHQRLGLDYVGLDCAETPDGSLLIFEADSDMIVHAMDPVDLFPYKQPQMRKLFAGFRHMLFDAIARGVS